MTRPMRVLELRSIRGTGGGPEKTILLSASRSDPRRVRVTVCYIRDARDETYDIGTRAAALGIDYVEIVERHSFDPAIWPALRRLVRERQIDIVHAHEHKTDLLALLLARAEGVAPIATAHGWSGRTPRERLYYFADRRLLARYPLVIAVSERIRQTIIAHGADEASVRRVPNGIDQPRIGRDPAARGAARAALSVPVDALVLGSIGRLEVVKRFDLLLDTVAILAGSCKVRAVIAGEGSERAALETRAAALGITACVRLLGHRTDVERLHPAFDVYVQSSDSEGVPNAVLESMAFETPVVATAVGGTSELVTHGVHGLLVARGDARALAAAVAATVADAPGAARRVRAARERIERELSFEARMGAVEHIYEELLTGWSARRRHRELGWARV